MICIYKLTFESGELYIGKTTNYRARIQQHLNSRGKGSPKLMKAFETSICLGSEIVEECLLETLDAREVYYIAALKPTLNTLPGGEGMSGLNHPRSKYTKEEVEYVVHLLSTTALSYAKITELTSVSEYMVGDICRGNNHVWATQGVDLSNRVDTKLAKVYSPEGKEVLITSSYKEFEEANSLPSGVLTYLHNDVGTSRYGWTKEAPERYKITSPEQDTLILTKAQAKRMFEDLEISRTSIDKLINKLKPVKGWSVAKI